MIPVFDTYKSVTTQTEGSFYNTIPSNPVGQSDQINLIIKLNNPKPTIAFNPFIIVDQQRGREIHVINRPPTSLMNFNLLNTGQDATAGEIDRWFATEGNLPWGLDLDCDFEYPIEGADILKAYPKLIDWVESSGTLFQDWHTNLSNGYRNTNKIF